MKRKVYILGSSNIDISYGVKAIAEKGYTVEAHSCTRATGGKGANQAVAAAHWGADVSMIGAVGDDGDGKVLLEVFKSHVIDHRHVYVVKGIPSGNAAIFVDDTGANCITVYPGANQCVPLDLPVSFQSSDILAAQLEVNINAVEHYFELAKAQGAYTILNPSPIQPIPARILEHTDMIVANESEAYEMSGIKIDGVDTAKLCVERIMESGPKAVIVTLGKNGAVVVAEGRMVHIPASPVKVVDTQGAGDAFLGSLAARLSEGSTVEEAAGFANTVAGLSVAKRGTT